jgi:hypothetical protein
VQLLAQIDALLHPKTHIYANYPVIITIPHIIGKPGLPLLSANDYTLLLECMHNKSILVNVTIITLKDESDKEHNAPAETVPKSKKASRDPRTLPGNVKQLANIKALQENWRCPKKTPTCLSLYCYINDEGTHIPLGNEQLECWASAGMYSLVILSTTLSNLFLQ